jgi:hypothetical protein
MSNETLDAIDKSLQLYFEKDIKGASKAIVDYMGYKTEASNKRAMNEIKEWFIWQKKFKGSPTKEALQFKISSLSEKRQRENGHFKSDKS